MQPLQRRRREGAERAYGLLRPSLPRIVVHPAQRAQQEGLQPGRRRGKAGARAARRSACRARARAAAPVPAPAPAPAFPGAPGPRRTHPSRAPRQGRHQAAQALDDRLRRLLGHEVAEREQRRAQAPQADAHLVQVLRIAALRHAARVRAGLGQRGGEDRAERLARRRELAEARPAPFARRRKRLARDEPVAALGLAFELERQAERLRDPGARSAAASGVACLELELDLADRLAPLPGGDVAAGRREISARVAPSTITAAELRAKRVSNIGRRRVASRATSSPVAARISSRGNAATSSRPRGAGISHSARALRSAPAADSTFRVCSRRVPSRRKPQRHACAPQPLVRGVVVSVGHHAPPPRARGAHLARRRGARPRASG